MASPVLGRGILRIYPSDLQHQLSTVQVINASGMKERLSALARFGRFFAGSLFDIYGGIFARPHLFDPDSPPRKKRELRVSAPEVHWFETEDGVKLRLTRYRGGSKGPVMLVPGLSVSSLIFAIDTIDTNLLEYLFANGYDVWLLDFRASIEMPSVLDDFTVDDVARYDYPAAVAKIQAVTGAETIQAVVHCYGAITFHMAMLAGLRGVRSAVSSQIGAHFKVNPFNRLKSGLYINSFLSNLGVDSLTAYTDEHDDWLDRLYNRAIQLNPSIDREEFCNSPVCHRITFLYALLYEHDQLNTATHDVLHEMFGVSSMKNFEHVGLLAREGKLLSADGEDIYLPNVERLAIPITYIHGVENEAWLPESTELTFNWLREHNGRHLYKRHLIANYGHIDCIFGKNAAVDVYPLILSHLEQTA
jgi:cholesterol oxidase